MALTVLCVSLFKTLYTVTYS